MHALKHVYIFCCTLDCCIECIWKGLMNYGGGFNQERRKNLMICFEKSCK
jgi:hypothetical protein